MIAVHETAHQWWYASVADDQEADPWLDEAFATYSERLYYEHFYPDLVDWWWAYRVTFYQPAGKIDQPVESYPGFTPYRNAVYLRGAQFLEAVRIKLGDEDFFALIKDYAQANAGKIVSADDFLSRIQAVTGVDPYTEFGDYLTITAHSQ
jgi:aminopeptidase N